MPDQRAPAATTLDSAATDLSGKNSRNGANKRRDPNEPVAVVGIGASAGGIAPLQHFFAEMAADSGLAFVVVMHLSPDFESQLAEVLQQKTQMPVVQVTEPVKVQPDHVYVIPPNHQLSFEDSMLRLLPPQQAQGRRVTIDLFFRTLAHAYGQRAVSIIMSGTDSDGVIGLKHVRAQGGVTIAQEPEEAEFDSMPLNAINTGMVDWVMHVGDMPARLLKFVHNENRMTLPPEIPEAEEPDEKVKDAPGGETISDETRDPLDEEAILLVLKHVRVQTGHDFSHYKRATVLRRIARRMQVNSINSIPPYLDFLRQHPAEAHALLHDLLIGVTHFFRDQGSFAALDANIPQLFAGKKSTDELRVWVTACATGEEAYSIAMLLCEHAAKLNDPPNVQVFATDIDDQSIHSAREGLYPTTIEADVSPERLRQFFMRDNGRYRVKKDIRDKVLFARHNVLSDPAFSRVDLATCRNLLIYLNRDAQRRVFDIFHFALRPGGLLFIGGAESADNSHSLFSPLDSHHRIYVRRSVPRPTWNIPSLPARVAAPERRGGKADRPMLPAMASTGVEDAGEQSQTSSYEGQGRRSVLFGELHLKLLEEYGPPSVVVNETYDIVHLSEKAGRYLTFHAGEPSTNLMTVVNSALRVELRTALFRAAQSNESVTVPRLRVPVGGAEEIINLQVRPIRPGDSAHGFFLVLFDKQTVPLTEAEETTERETISREVGDELQSLKEQLNATVEQFEVSSEELKASNEELQAMNEELRSAAEELETSKEELQSVNEELITVNHELKEKVEEVSRSNSDLNNLITSTDLATIFLDRQLGVVRFTPRMQEFFNLLPADVGRPISDITHKLHYDALTADAERVLERLAPVEREVETGDGRSFLARIAPYRTVDDKISGVVLTLVDLTQIKQAQAEVRAISHQMEAQSLRFQTILEAVPDFIYEFDLQGRFTFINPSLLRLWGKTAEEAIGKNFHELDYPPELATKLQRQIQQVIGTRKSLQDETPYTSKIGERMYEYLFFPLFGEGEKVDAVAGVTRDITERRRAESALRESERRLQRMVNVARVGVMTLDPKGVILHTNEALIEMLGYERAEFEKRAFTWRDFTPPEHMAASIRVMEQLAVTGRCGPYEKEYLRKDGTRIWMMLVGADLGDGTMVKYAIDISDRKRAEEAERASEERFRLLVEGAKDYAMFLLDLDNVITFWSNGAERVFGWNEAEAVGQTGALIFVPEDIEKGAVEKEIVGAMNEGRAPDRRWHLRKDGSRIWVDGVMTRIDDAAGPRGLAKIARDATDLREAEDELRHARDEMEQRVIERTQDLLATNSELERTMTQRQQLERELLEISEREKRRIGEDLHDMVCQELTATALFLKSTAKKLGPQDAGAAKMLEESAETVNRNVVLARKLAGGLQAIELTASGLKNALRDLAAGVCANSGIKCHVKIARGVEVPDDTVALHLYRVAQEAVTNAVKHSGAKNILITLDRNKTHTCVSVQDDGKGLVVRKRGKGLGLHMMRYRANALGGELKIELRRTGGTDITCVIPTKR
jgi:two-component system CheB/CheR fusion protein